MQNGKKEKINEFIPTTQGKRFLNYILDSIIFGLVFIPIFVIIMYFIALYPIIEEMNELLFVIIMIPIYYIIFESIWSKTPAKFITGTRVVTKDGEEPEFSDIFVRTLTRFVPFEAFSLLTSNRPQGWHDRWSETMVIDDFSDQNKEKNNKADEKFINNIEPTKTEELIKINNQKKINYCSQCGNKLEKNDKFCAKCGIKI